MHQVVWRVKNFILISIPDPYEAVAEGKDIGPETGGVQDRWTLTVRDSCGTVTEIVGYRESRQNTGGPSVTRISEHRGCGLCVGLRGPRYWCALFVVWLF